MDENYEEVPSSQEQPEEKKGGNTMRKLIYGLLAVALVLTAVVFAQSSNQHQGDGASSTDDIWSGETFIVHGVTIRWYPDYSEGKRMTLTEWDSDELFCNHGYSAEFFKGATPADLSWMVGYCFYNLGLTITEDYQVPENARDYASFYSDSYLEKCGDTYEPLAWNNTKDGSCDLPHPEEVSEAYFAQDG